MRAAIYNGTGGPEVIEIKQVPIPRPGKREVLIRVQASALNRADILQRLGFYPAPEGWPSDIPGLEFVGIVEELGPEAKLVKRGQRVFGVVGGGAHAEFLITHEQLLVAVPEHFDTMQAAAIPESYMTAYDALFTRASFSRGERVLIHAATGGVGTAFVQIAKHFGGQVFTTTRSGDKLDRLRALGSEYAIDTSINDFSEVILGETKGQGVDICIDFVGGAYLEKNINALAIDGRLVILGLLGGIDANIRLERFLNKRLSIIGTQLRGRPLTEKARITKLFSDEVVPLLSDGTIQPIINRAFSLDELAEAHRYIISNAGIGKIIISISE